MAARLASLVVIALLVASVDLTSASEREEFDDYNQDDDDGVAQREKCTGYLCKFHATCGRAVLNSRSPKQRLVGGNPARYGNWPSYARLLVPGSFCGGVLISDKHVLTAAHCVEGVRVSEVKVILGELVLNATDKYEQRIGASGICRASKYRTKLIAAQRRETRHDWAVVTLERLPELSNYVEPACMPPSERVDGTTCFVVGAGQISNQPKRPKLYPEVVQEMAAIETNCEPYFKEISRLDESRSCWTKKRASGQACYGDSGGPILCLDYERQPKRWRVAGLVSHLGHGYCDGAGFSRFVTVFTRIPNLIRDIQAECKL